MSATRSSSSSLRRRLAWTAASAAMIGMVSLVTVVLSRNQERAPVQLAIKAPVQQDEAVVRGAAGAANAKANGKNLNRTQTTEAAVEPPPGPKPAGDFHSARYGYTVSLEGTPWTRWENLAEVVPEAEWGALLGSFGRLLVIPVSIAGLEPWPEAINYALLARLGIAYPSDQLTDFAAIEHNGATGHAFRMRREVAGAVNSYHLWLLRRGDSAFLYTAWIDEAAAKTASKNIEPPQFADLLERLSFDEPASEPAPIEHLNARQRQSHSAIYNDLGMFSFNARDFAGAIQSFRCAFELQPDDPAILMNLVNSHIELNHYREALDELERHVRRFPGQPDLWAARAYLLSQSGQIDSALAAYAALFGAGYRAEGPFAQYATLLAKNDRLDEALGATEGFLKSQDSFAVRKLQASLHRQRGDHDRAIAILTALQQNRPFNAELAYDLADNFIAVARYQDAIEMCHELFSNRYDTAYTYLLQARCQYALRWYTEARAFLEAALKREPANRDAQELVSVVAAMLGEGNNGAIKEPIAPVPLPDQFAAASTAPEDDAHLKSYGAYYLSRYVAIEFDAGKQCKLTDRRTIRVLDASGIVRFSTIQVPFDPLGEQLYVNSLRVLDADGKEVAVGKTSDYYVIDGTRSQPATHGKMLNIPVPGLQAGRTIELVFTRRDLAPPAEFPYTAHTFSSEVPVLSAALCVKADEAAMKHFASPGVKLAPIDDGLVWSIERPLVFRMEPLPQPRSTFLPRVVIGSSTAKWDQLVKAYLAQIADRLAADSAVVELAKKLTTDAKDDDERLAALVHYVQDHLTYKAIEFGRRARVPNRPVEVLKNGYGDCKDHSLLLLQLLSAAGIKAHLALASFEEPVDPDFASLEQFNHMLVFVPQSPSAGNASDSSGRFFDCTDKDCNLLAIDAPLDLGSTKVLVLDDDQPRFADVPPYAADSSRIDVARTVRLEQNSDAAVEETVTIEGYHAAFLRNLFKEVPAANRATALQEELSPLGGTMQIQSVEIENLAEGEKPLVFKATYLVRNRFHVAGDTLLGQLPALWERMYLDVQPIPQRRTPFAVEFPLNFSSKIDFVVPPGYEAEAPAGMNNQSQSSYAAWKLQTAAKPDGIHIDYELRLPTGRYPASEYAAYEQALQQAVAALTQSIVLKRAPVQCTLHAPP